MAHIILKEHTPCETILQDIMLRPPEKYSLELHLDKNRELVSLIILDCRANHENLIRILQFFVKKYQKMNDFDAVVLELLQIIKELRKLKPMYPKHLFRFDSE